MSLTYEQLEPTMDAEVEDRLGDSIIYTPAGGAPITIRGFINLYSDPGALDGADPIRRRYQVKINRARLPAGPKTLDRLTHPKLGNVAYKPSTGTIVDDGRAWSFGIQRA